MRDHLLQVALLASIGYLGFAVSGPSVFCVVLKLVVFKMEACWKVAFRNKLDKNDKKTSCQCIFEDHWIMED